MKRCKKLHSKTEQSSDIFQSASKIFAGVCILFVVSLWSHAANDVDKVIEKDFWGNIYKSGGDTFFTNTEFAKKSPLLTASYVYPLQLIRDHLNCGSNRQCLRKSEQYQKILSDLHNIVPEKSSLAFKLRSSFFGEVGDEVAPDEFGMKLRMNLIEPPNDRKGDIARIIYYMHDTYGLPLFGSNRELVAWNEQDPPSDIERNRNEKIATIQGTRNSYIDNPERIQ